MIDNKRAAEIAKECYQAVYRQSLSLVGGNENEALDITQETFLFFAQKRETLEDNNISSWLLRVAWLKTKEHFKEKEMKNVLLDKVCMSSGDDECWDEYFIDEKVKEDIRKLTAYKDAIAKLKPKDKAFLDLVVEHDFDYKSVAKVCNTNNNNIGVKMHRLRQKLISFLPEDLRAPFLMIFLLFLNFFKNF